MSKIQEPESPDSLVGTIYHGLLSFNLWPANADETYRDILDDMSETAGNSSESDAIEAAWRAVGENLSYAIAKYATEHGQTND